MFPMINFFLFPLLGSNQILFASFYSLLKNDIFTVDHKTGSVTRLQYEGRGPIRVMGCLTC